MAYDDMRSLHERARQEADAFLARSREQMMASLQEQHTRLAGVQYGGGFMQAPGGGGYPMPGTPAGRLMDTLTDLARKGASVAGVPIAAAGGAAAQTHQFLMGNAPFGTAGVWGGAASGAQRNMSFMQAAFTAYGSGIDAPFPIGNLGKWAGQRLDMERHQAQKMAQDELTYRVERGLQRGAWGLVEAGTMGLVPYWMRRAGVGYENMHSTLFARNMQTQSQFVTRDDLRAAGMGNLAGPFETGMSYKGGKVFGQAMAREMSFLEREMGLAPEEAIAVQNRAMGTMGISRYRELVRQGPEALARETGKQSRSVREIQQTLRLSEAEAKEFFDTMGQMYGTAERMVGMTREAKRYAGSWGMNIRQVFEAMRGFEDMGRVTALGQTRARHMGMEYMDEMRQQQRVGAISREEMMMYGGATEEEGMVIRAQRRIQQNIGMFRGGMTGGFEVLALQNPRQYARFMGGRMSAMQAAGAVGEEMVRNPFAALAAQYDPAIEARMGQDAMRLQYERVQQEAKQGFFVGGTEGEQIRRFQGLTNLAPLEAAREFRMFGREADVFGRLGQRRFGDAGAGRNLQELYGEVRARGMLGFVTTATGQASTYEGVARLYEMMGGTGERTMDLDQALRVAAGRPIHAEEVARSFGFTAGAVKSVLSPWLGGAEIMATGEAKRLRAFAMGGRLSQGQIAKLDRAQKAKAYLPEMFSAVASGQLSGLIDDIIQRGGSGQVTAILTGMGASGSNIEMEGGGIAQVEMIGGGKVRVARPGDREPLEVDSSELGKLLGEKGAFQFYHRIISNLGGVEQRVADMAKEGIIGSDAVLAYESALFSQYAGFSNAVFDSGVNDMRTLTDRMANMENLGIRGRTATLERLSAWGMESGGLAFAKAFSSMGGKLAVQQLSGIQGMFGSEEAAAKAIQAAFGPDAGKDWDETRIVTALKGGEGADKLKAALSSNVMATELLNQMLKVGGVEFQVPKGRSASDAIWIRWKGQTAYKEETT